MHPSEPSSLGGAPSPARPDARTVLRELERVLRERLTSEEGSLSGQVTRGNRVNYAVLEGIVRQEPMLRRGITKHAGDLVKHGGELLTVDGKETHEWDATLQAWLRHVGFWRELKVALMGAHLYGDGFLELVYDDGGEPDEPATGPLATVKEVEPTSCRFVRRVDPATGLRGYYLAQRLSGTEVVLHPSRFHHLVLTPLPGRKHGLSTAENAYHAALAKVKGDQGSGEIVYHSGVPWRHATVEGGNPADIAAVYKMLTDPKFTKVIVWDERLKVAQLNPSAVSMKEFHEAWQDSIAAAVGLPVMILKGAQAGQLEGSETNLAHYYGDLAETANNVLGPLMERVVAGTLGLTTTQYSWKWHPYPNTPHGDAVLLRERATAYATLVAARVKPVAAARVAMLDLNPDDFEDEHRGVAPPVDEDPGEEPTGGSTEEPDTEDEEGEPPGR